MEGKMLFKVDNMQVKFSLEENWVWEGQSCLLKGKNLMFAKILLVSQEPLVSQESYDIPTQASHVYPSSNDTSHFIV